ncbi:MAG: ATP-binding cassette domain-containing protein [Alphaproteobacteria bacterium]|nr:ATP-binding cassette domain-containing protein [Alphaproteobacteria bacterium]
MSDDQDKPRAGLGVLRRLGGYVRPYRGRVAVAAIALTAASLAVLGFGAGLRWLVDTGFATGDSSRLDQALLGLLVVVAALSIATFARALMVAWIGERIAADLRRSVFDHVLSLSPAFFETTRVGDVISRLVADTTLLQTIVGSSLSMALRNVLLVVGGTTMMAVTSPKLTLLTFGVLPLVVAPIIVFGRRVRALSRASQDRLADTGADIEETLNAVRTVQAFGREPERRDHFAARVEATVAAAHRRNRARAALAAVVIMLVFGAIGIVLWIGGHAAIAGDISAGQLSAFVFYAVVVAGSVGSLSEFIGDLQRAAGAAERLFELLDARSDIAVPAAPLPLPVPPRGALVFDRVGFTYPTRPERPAIDELSLDVAPGEAVAIVGPSGSGKSTILQLALRFYDPQAGRILFDGVDIRHCDPADLRRRVALVPQEPVIFATDVAANIRFARPEASDAELRAAADAAHALEFIERLPQGFATQLGEKGQRLSTGQKQRLAIARAILRDPAVLLLDEATSALDAESERLVQKALDGLARSRTTLVIAHRLATVQRADRIVVLDRGRVVETGPHAVLAQAGGLYARLASLQLLADMPS